MAEPPKPGPDMKDIDLKQDIQEWDSVTPTRDYFSKPLRHKSTRTNQFTCFLIGL